MLEAATKRLCDNDRPRLLRWRSVEHLEPWREFYATPEVMDELKVTWQPTTGERIERAAMRRSLMHILIEHWLGGGPMFVGGDIKQIGRWREGVWEFKTGSIRPYSRLFGFMPDKNVFIAVGLYSRDYLGFGRSQQWSDALEGAASTWRTLFSNDNPLVCPPEIYFDDPELLKGYWDDK
jgi:hypothetical protein